MSQLEVDKVIPQSGTTLTLGESGDTVTIPSGATFTPTLTAPIIDEINDNNGNEEIIFTTTTSAVNELTIANAATGNAPEIAATGDDTDIDLKLTPKGAGNLVLDGIEFPNADGSANQVLQTNGSGVLSFSTLSSDYVLLATTIASSVASVSFDGFFSSTYTNYEVIISDASPVSANVNLKCRFRRSNSDVTASNYSAAGRRTYEVKGASDANDGRFTDDQDNIELLTNSSPASSSRTTGSKIIIYNPLSTTSYKKVTFQSIGPSDDAGGTFGLWNVNQAGQLTDNTNALSGISFFYASGNILEGVFKLYGIK